ncbi:hypothetical protein [Luteococcus peritonei]|uniref:Lipopolysaccharide biosynthesis protein n=1 Tax=Luteococcus peritonei TaxID=88874 RepID=A0ABW4RSE4_9ACTN
MTPAAPPSRWAGLLGRLPGWFPAVGDQGVIAVTNLALSVMVSRTGGVAALGVYALVSMTMLACLGFERTLVTDPWLSSRLSVFPRRAHQGDQMDATAFGAELRTVVLGSSLLVALPTLVVAWVAGGGWGPWLIAGPCAALFVLQDAGRYSAYKRADTWRAFVSDLLLMLVTLGGLGLGVLLGRLGIGWILTSYALGFVVGMIPTARWLAGPVMPGQTGRWWRSVCRPLGMPLLQDSVAYFVSTNVSSYLLAALASKATVGGVRVVTTLYSPLAMIFTGMSMWLVPALTQRGHAASAGLRRKAMLGLSVIGALVTLAAVALGPWVAPLVFGHDANVSRMALLLGGISTWMNAVASTWLATVKVFGRYRPISWARTISGALMIVLMLVMAATHSVDGYLMLLLLQNAAIALVAWMVQRSPSTSDAR